MSYVHIANIYGFFLLFFFIFTLFVVASSTFIIAVIVAAVDSYNKDNTNMHTIHISYIVVSLFSNDNP